MSALFSSDECARAVTVAGDREIRLSAEAGAPDVHSTPDGVTSVQAEQGPQYLHPLNSVWRGMHYRCSDPRHRDYEDYGGRGIRVCARWSGSGGFWNFVADMPPRPAGLTIDRYPNNDGNYEPGNCRWATRLEQTRNRRNTVRVAVGSEHPALAEVAGEAPISLEAVKARLARGVALHVAITVAGRAGFRVTQRPSPDAHTVLRVTELALAGVSRRRLARELQLGTHVVVEAIRSARAEGLLPPKGVSRAKTGPVGNGCDERPAK